MKRFNVKMYIVLAIVAMLGISMLIVGFADGNTPGSTEDPIVTQSYVAKVVEGLRSYVDSTISNIYADITKLNGSISANTEAINSLKAQLDIKTQEISALQKQLQNTTAPTYEVILLKKGTTLVSGKGTEIIVRSGKCVGIATNNGGLADATAGKDIKTDEAIELNHLLIASRDDGRGLKALEDSYMIVRGVYTLK
jgi:hypothetical protein